MAPGTLSPNERAARGKAARGQASRSSHAAWRAPDERRSPIAVLEEQARTRVPELVPIRYGRMVESPFAYFRGAAAAMADDLSRTPASGLRAQLCGDAHLSNFGGFASPDRDLVFDLNDFDETLPGPWEWDVKRLAASFEIAGRSRDFDRDQRSATVAAAAREYRIAMRRFATMRDLAVWYARLDADEVIRRWGAEEDGKAAKVVRRAAEKRGPRTACGRWPSSLVGSKASCASPATLRSWSGSKSWSGRRTGATSARRSIGCSRRTAARCPAARAMRSRRTASSTSHARSSASAAWARGRTSCCCSGATRRIRSSSRSRRPSARSSSPMPAPAASRTTAAAWSRGSG